MVSCGLKEGVRMVRKNKEKAKVDNNQALEHVGGVNDALGGVDPEIDATLMRLSGGP